MHAPPQFLLDFPELRPHAVPSSPPLEEDAPLSDATDPRPIPFSLTVTPPSSRMPEPFSNQADDARVAESFAQSHQPAKMIESPI
jgi:hypothetical protein